MGPTYIVGYDGSPSARAALEFTRELARTTGARVVVAHVYPVLAGLYVSPYSGPGPAKRYAEADAAGMAAATRLLDEVEGDVDRVAIPGGSEPYELHAMARSERPALLAVGATHHGALGRLVPGSVAERVVHGSPCPVLVVPPEVRRDAIETIAVGYDGRGEARRALRLAESLAERAGARLRLVAAVDPGPVDAGAPLADGQLDEVAGSRFAATLERVAARTRRGGLEVDTQLVLAPAGDGLVRACSDGRVDLLVTGSRGYGPVRSVMLGGASRHVVDHAPCPVLVVPHAASVAAVTEALSASAEA